MTWFYRKFGASINTLLKPLGLWLIATFEGDPPATPMRVTRMRIERRKYFKLPMR